MLLFLGRDNLMIWMEQHLSSRMIVRVSEAINFTHRITITRKRPRVSSSTQTAEEESITEVVFTRQEVDDLVRVGY